MNLDEISGEIVDASMCVHSVLGPSLLESAYEMCLAYELRSRGLNVRTQVPVPVVYKGVRIGVGYRIDLLVEASVVLELKVVSKLTPLDEAQLLSYLKLSTHKVGLLLNFNVVHMRDGVKRMVNNL